MLSLHRIYFHKCLPEGTADNIFEAGKQSKGTYCLLKIPVYTMVCIKCDLSSNLREWFANAFLLEL